MGVFDWVGNVIDGVKNVVKNVVEFVTEEAPKIVENVAAGIWNFLSGTARDIGEQDSYEGETASMEETSKVNNSLSVFKNKTIKEVAKLERGLVEIYNKCFDDQIELIETIAEKTNIKLNIESMHNEAKVNIRRIEDSIKKEIMPKISVDNEKCLAILNLEAGKKKEKAMEEFIVNVLRDAGEELKKNIELSVKNNINHINELLKVHLDSAKSFRERSINDLNNILKTEGADNNKKELEQFKIAYRMYIENIGVTLLKNTDR